MRYCFAIDVIFETPWAGVLSKRVSALFHARGSSVEGRSEPIGASQPDRLRRMVERGPRRRYGDPGISESEPTRTTFGCGYPRRHRGVADWAGAREAVR